MVYCDISVVVLYLTTLPPLYWYGKGVCFVSILSSFIISIMAGIVCHYICKWLDGDEQQVVSLRFKPPCPIGIEKPRSCDLRGFLRAICEHFHHFCLIALQHMQVAFSSIPYFNQQYTMFFSDIPLLFIFFECTVRHHLIIFFSYLVYRFHSYKFLLQKTHEITTRGFFVSNWILISFCLAALYQMK